MPDDINGPVILWTNYGCEGWKPKSFDSVKDALEADKYGSEFVIARKVQYEIKELS